MIRSPAAAGHPRTHTRAYIYAYEYIDVLLAGLLEAPSRRPPPSKQVATRFLHGRRSRTVFFPLPPFISAYHEITEKIKRVENK